MQTWKQEPRMTACKDQALPLCLMGPVWNVDTLSSLCQAGMCCSSSITPPVVEARELGSWSRQKAQKIYFQNIREVEMLTGARLSCPPRGCNCPWACKVPGDPVCVGVCGCAERVRRIWSHMKPLPAQPQCVLTSSSACCTAAAWQGWKKNSTLHSYCWSPTWSAESYIKGYIRKLF